MFCNVKLRYIEQTLNVWIDTIENTPERHCRKRVNKHALAQGGGQQ